MKNLLPIALVLFTANSFAQSTFKFTNPESSQYAPQSITAAQANQEAQSEKANCGFSSAYISHADLQPLLDTRNAVGIRIYNGKNDSNQEFCGIIAVAINEDGKEVPLTGKKYLFGTSYDNDHNCPSNKVNKSNAEGYAQIVANSSSLEHQKVFFSKTVIEGLKTGSSTGVHFRPGDIGGHKTMIVSSAKLDKGQITDTDDTRLKSTLPCPTECGTTDNYLNAK